MPIYEYRCGQCERRFQLLRSMSQLGEPACCPACGANHGERVVSTFSSRTKDGGGASRSLGGGSCASCAASSCKSCAH